jgi:hypothetical protein
VEGREVEVELEVRLEDVMGRLHGSLVWSGCGCCLVLVLLVVAPLLVLACWVFSGASSERWSSGGAASSSATPARLARQLLLPARLTSQHSHQTRMNRQPEAERLFVSWPPRPEDHNKKGPRSFRPWLHASMPQSAGLEMGI